jgi:hypothetical protein
MPSFWIKLEQHKITVLGQVVDGLLEPCFSKYSAAIDASFWKCAELLGFLQILSF